jgi:hypothetical protein
MEAPDEVIVLGPDPCGATDFYTAILGDLKAWGRTEEEALRNLDSALQTRSLGK